MREEDRFTRAMRLLCRADDRVVDLFFGDVPRCKVGELPIANPRRGPGRSRTAVSLMTRKVIPL